ncbi:MAG: MBL fold metallo-hydrolase [Ilumatobacteraceae bacterium]
MILGSGTPNPDPERAGSSVAVVDGASWLMVDCGRAATQRALSAGLDLTTVVAVLITHHHSDHLSDLATLATTRWCAGATTPLTVVAPTGPATTFAGTCLDAFADQAFHHQAPASGGSRPSIEVVAFDASAEVTEVLDADGWSGSSVLVDHHPVKPAVGYRIQRGGIRVVISGDTTVCDGIRLLADGANVLVHEALLSQRVSVSLLDWNASARSVGELAAATQPQTLIITHLIPSPTTADDEQAYLDEVREGGFAGPTLVAHDLLRLDSVG